MHASPEPRPRLSGRASLWLLAFAIWSLPVLVFSILPVLLQPERAAGLLTMFMRQGLAWYLWALFTPLILWLAERWPIGPGLRRNLLRHIGAATLLGLAFNFAFMTLSFTFRPAEWPEHLRLARVLVTGLMVWLPFSYMVYALVASMGTAFTYYRRMRDREITASRLEARLIEAQLSALRMQLQPHFLFNALNTIAMLVRQGEARTSVRMIARLSELLRHVLDESGEPEIPLGQELLLVQRYLEIEQLRFGDRLVFECDVPAELTDALVPNLLLQPIVENAVRHGISRRAAAGRITLRARRHDGHLRLEVIDDGPGLAADALLNGGLGVRNTRARLEHLYGDRAALALENAAPTGVRVRIEVPWHTADTPAPGSVHA